MSGTEELGRGGRLRGAAAGELVAAAFAAESAHGPRLAHGLSLADLAHAVALVEGGDLAGDDAKALLRGLLELHEIPGAAFPWDPALGDAFNSREAELERRVGRSAAGWLSAGRPRRDITCNLGTFVSAVTSASVKPAIRCSSSELPEMFRNGKTASRGSNTSDVSTSIFGTDLIGSVGMAKR